jgi:tight adherence protein B
MSGWLLAAVGLAGAAVALWAPGRPRLPARTEVSAGPRGRGGPLVVLVAGSALVAVVAGLPGQQIALLAIFAVGLGGVRRLLQHGRAARAAAVRRQRVVEACEAVVGELRAGRPALQALESGADAWPEMVLVARAARLDGDVTGALRDLGSRPGAEELTRVAAAWQLSSSTGSGLASAVARVLDSSRARQATDRLVQAELASARATARLVVALPVVVLLASDGMGADPWGFLLSTWPGLVCLAGGVVLALTGLEWIERIAGRAAGGLG